MDAYTAFSRVYDRLMENVPYELWAEKIDRFIKEYGISKPCRDATDPLESERNLVLDLGCGTGKLTRLMYDKGYDMIGIDISPEMLEIARSKSGNLDVECDLYNEKIAKSQEDEILYICQDMCELDLYSTVGTVISTCDSINYLLEDEEIMACFEGVSKFLYPGGLFIFDFNTVYKYRDVIGETTIAENDEDVSFIWENFFDEEEGINEIDLTLFIKSETDDNLFIKEEEVHCQRGYTYSQICGYLKKAGLSVVKAVDERKLGEAESGAEYVEGFDTAERIFVIAKK